MDDLENWYGNISGGLFGRKDGSRLWRALNVRMRLVDFILRFGFFFHSHVARGIFCLILESELWPPKVRLRIWLL